MSEVVIGGLIGIFGSIFGALVGVLGTFWVEKRKEHRQLIQERIRAYDQLYTTALELKNRLEILVAQMEMMYGEQELTDSLQEGRRALDVFARPIRKRA